MAERSSSYEAVLLRSKEVPSGARVVTLLSAEKGLVDAFVFGGGKSKLRSLASPWHSGTAWTYRDAAKDFVKLTDFDPALEFPSIRRDLRAIGAATFFAEFMAATSALGGDWEDAFRLTVDALGAVDSAAERGDAAAADRAVVLFAVRALSIMGMMPDALECSACGADGPTACGIEGPTACGIGGANGGAARRGDRAGATGGFGLHWYSRRDGGFVCASCAGAAGGSDPASLGFIEIQPGAIAWLGAAERADFASAAALGLAREALAGLKAAALDLAGKAAGGPLRSIASGLV